MAGISKILSDFTKAIGSSGIQLVITLFSTPIMTRLYAPEAYTSFSIVNSMATLLIGIGLFALPNAYPLEKDRGARLHIIQTMLMLLIGFTALAGLISAAMIWNSRFFADIDIPASAAFFLPVIVFTYGLRQIFIAIANHRANFNPVALGRMVEPMVSRGGSIGLGAVVGGHPALILFSIATGNIVASTIIFRSLSQNIRYALRLCLDDRPNPLQVMRRFKEFVVYGTLINQLQAIAMLGIQITLAAQFSEALAGQFILASSIISLPMVLVALATAPVTYRHFIEMASRAPSRIFSQLMLAVLFYLSAGALLLLPIIFWGPEIFHFAFGSTWEKAGSIAGTLAMAYSISFATVGVQSIFRITKQLRLHFILGLSTYSALLILAVYFFHHMAFDHAILAFAGVWALRNIVELISCMIVSFLYSRSHRDEATA